MNEMSNLRLFMYDHYNREELKILCFDLGIKYEDLGEGGYSTLLPSFLLYIGRRRHFDKLLELLQEQRPEAFADSSLSTDPIFIDQLYAQLPAHEIESVINADEKAQEEAQKQKWEDDFRILQSWDRKRLLRGLDLSERDLIKIDLENADLTGSNLSNAILKEANLSKTNLRNVNFSGADLRKANLCGADLTGANIRWAKLQKIEVDDQTTARWLKFWKIANSTEFLWYLWPVLLLIANILTEPNSEVVPVSESTPKDSPEK